MRPVDNILPSSLKGNQKLLHGLIFLLAAGAVLSKYDGEDENDLLLEQYYKKYGKKKIYRSEWTGKENT